MTSAVAGRIVEVSDEGRNRIGLIEFGGKRRQIYLDLVPNAGVGDWVRFHAGFATEQVRMGPSVPVVEDVEKALDPDNLQAWRLLSELDPQQLQKLIPLACDKQYGVGQTVFHSGERSLFLHLIVSGEVELMEDTGNFPVPVHTLHAGDAMGWSAITGEPRTHFEARALSRVRTVAFPGDQLRKVCDEDQALVKRLLEVVTERLDAVRLKLVQRNPPDGALKAAAA